MVDKSECSKRASLLASASVVVWVTAQGASAAEWALEWGGYMDVWLGYQSTSGPAGDFDGVDVISNSEIFVLPSITLDNGITFGAQVQLEGTGGSGYYGDADIDEAFVFVRGSFGEIQIGQSPQPGFDVFNRPDLSFTDLSSPVFSAFFPVSGASNGMLTGDDFRRGTLGGTNYSASGQDNAFRITYFTPQFSGFQLGVSFAPDGRDSSGDVYGQREEMYDVALRYAGEFGAIRVAAGATYGTGENSVDPAANPEYQGFSVNFGYEGFNLGGSFIETQGSSRTQADGAAYEIGGSYESGPWVFSASYLHGNNTDNEHTGFGPRERFDAVKLAGSYELKKGVRVSAFGAYVDFDEDVGDGGFGTPGDNFDGFVIGTGIGLSW